MWCALVGTIITSVFVYASCYQSRLQKMEVSRARCVATLAFLLSLSGAALAQSVVDNKNCDDKSIHCPKDGEPSYKKYCCVDNNGGLSLYSCCNPYFGLIIGVSVGIPIIILIIVALVAAYCMCHHYHNRKMRTLVATYHRRRREADRRREARFLAPPPYSMLSEEGEGGPNSELPAYSEADPYKPNDSHTSRNVEEERGGNGGSSNEEGLTPDLETVASVELEEGGEGGSTSTEQSSSDCAPLLDEGGEQ